MVAQLLDYGSWVKDLGHAISALFSEHHHGARLEEEFENGSVTCCPTRDQSLRLAVVVGGATQ